MTLTNPYAKGQAKGRLIKPQNNTIMGRQSQQRISNTKKLSDNIAKPAAPFSNWTIMPPLVPQVPPQAFAFPQQYCYYYAPPPTTACCAKHSVWLMGKRVGRPPHDAHCQFRIMQLKARQKQLLESKNC